MIQKLKYKIDHIELDWMGLSQRYLIKLSALAVLASWVVFFVIGPTWGIDFTGGTEIKIHFEEPIDVTTLRSSLATIDVPGEAIQSTGVGGHGFKIRLSDTSFGAERLQTEVVDHLRTAFGPDWVKSSEINTDVGGQLTIGYNGAFVSLERIQDAIESVQGARVLEAPSDNTVRIELPGTSSVLQAALGEVFQDRDYEIVSIDEVGPKVGGSLKQSGVISLFASLVMILIYVGFRFDLTYAPGAVIALFHDVSITIGLFVLLGREFNLQMIGALLTIVGYSINDTIVIFDRIRENRARVRQGDLMEIVNRSHSETFARTVGTSSTTLLAISPFLVMNDPGVVDFILALFFGITIGTYSSIFVASHFIFVMERIQPSLIRFFSFIDEDEDPESVDEIPESFLSESEKRRRQRAQLEAQNQNSDLLS